MKKIFYFLFSLFLISCTNSDKKNINNLVYRKKSLPNSVSTKNKNYSNFIEEKQLLFKCFKKWEGTPYLWGGETRLGIDCSAFMQKIFEDIYDTNIPRTTGEQMKEGLNPGYKNRQLGDLIFFKTSSDTFHVGIYYENDNFFHSSSTFGVTMSNLNEKFWKDTYLKIRRMSKKND